MTVLDAVGRVTDVWQLALGAGVLAPFFGALERLAPQARAGTRHEPFAARGEAFVTEASWAAKAAFMAKLLGTDGARFSPKRERRAPESRRPLGEGEELLFGGDERTRSASSRGDALDLLLAARDESGAPLDRTLVHDELLTLLIAGHESTANALTWCLALLARNPTEVRLLRIELDALEGPITFDALTRLPRTRAVIDETLRLYPPAWSFGRAPIRDDTVDGFLLPKDHLVMIAPWAIHRDRNVFPHPEAFEPDRFLRGEPPPFSYLPFGGGARTCIGHAFARTEARVLLATWIRDLDFELVAGQSLDPVPLVTLRPRDGVSMRVRKRAS